jgi:lysophospholipase L1-like esterase
MDLLFATPYFSHVFHMRICHQMTHTRRNYMNEYESHSDEAAPWLPSRRKVLTGALSVGALGAWRGLKAEEREDDSASVMTLKKGSVILFQGDSITDAGRKKEIAEANDSGALGKGYPAMAAGELLSEYPDLELKIYNRGISGNKVPDLAARWKEDTLDLQPTILSVLVGINDLWHTVAFGKKYKGTIEDYEKGFRELLSQSLTELTGVRLVVCEPFTLREWPEFDPYRDAAAKIAAEMKLTLVPFQSAFNEATKAAPSKFWLWDGIHPTPAGHALMVRTWRKAVGV